MRSGDDEEGVGGQPALLAGRVGVDDAVLFEAELALAELAAVRDAGANVSVVPKADEPRHAVDDDALPDRAGQVSEE